MANKVTLITPPDIFENSNNSILLIGLSDKDQDLASTWLGNNESSNNVNIYFYQGEVNMGWLLFALNRANATFINLDSDKQIINIMASYILGKPGVFYSCKDANIKALIGYINNNFVPDVEKFLEKALNEQGQ